MAVTFDSIASVTLGTAASSISISSIPSSYTDLKAYFVFRSSGNASTNNIPVLRLNSVSTSNYNATYMSSGATTRNGGTNNDKDGLWVGGGAYTANSTNWFFAELNIMDYASTRFKLIDARFSGAQTGGANQEATILNGLNKTLTSAVNTISISDAIFGNTYAAGTTLSLFGILRA
jgi:hypothetical protein